MQPMLQLSLWPPLWLRFYIYTLLVYINTGLIEADCLSLSVVYRHLRKASNADIKKELSNCEAAAKNNRYNHFFSFFHELFETWVVV